MTDDLTAIACAALTATRHSLVDADAHAPDSPGLYAIFGATATWRQLGFGDPPSEGPLYVGKAERSLKARDLRQHFQTGFTGSSTVRRTIAALLRDAHPFRGVPRNRQKPKKSSHFGLEPEDDQALTAWMSEHLELAFWQQPIDCVVLRKVEVNVIGHFVPPMNINNNLTSPWRGMLLKARGLMADDARKWALARGFKI